MPDLDPTESSVINESQSISEADNEPENETRGSISRLALAVLIQKVVQTMFIGKSLL